MCILELFTIIFSLSTKVFQFFEFKSFVWMFVIRNSLFVSKIHTQFLTIVHNMFSVASVKLVTASIIQLITKGVR